MATNNKLKNKKLIKLQCLKEELIKNIAGCEGCIGCQYSWNELNRINKILSSMKHE